MEHPDEAQRLREELLQTKEQYTRAQHDYDLALSVAIDTGFSSDGSKGLKLATRRYAIALREYNAAVRRMTNYLNSH